MALLRALLVFLSAAALLPHTSEAIDPVRRLGLSGRVTGIGENNHIVRRYRHTVARCFRTSRDVTACRRSLALGLGCPFTH